jgi:hypothetical protein
MPKLSVTRIQLFLIQTNTSSYNPNPATAPPNRRDNIQVVVTDSGTRARRPRRAAAPPYDYNFIEFNTYRNVDVVHQNPHRMGIAAAIGHSPHQQGKCSH